MILKYLLVCCLVIALSACNTKPEAKSYDQFHHIEHWDELDDIEKDFTIIYYYSPFCDICISLEEDVTKYLGQLESDFTIYLIDDGMIYEQGEPPFETRGVPALFIYNNGEFLEMINGSVPVMDYLSNLVDNQ